MFFGDYREGSTTQVRFPRDADGKYNPKGEYRDKTVLLTVKYNKQGRFCLGVGIVDRGAGPVGERIELFDYTTKNIISVKDTDELIKRTIAAVKQLPRDHKRWIISNRIEGVFYSNDPLTVIDGVGEEKAALLAGAGINSISKLVKLKDKTIQKSSKHSRHQRLWSLRYGRQRKEQSSG